MNKILFLLSNDLKRILLGSPTAMFGWVVLLYRCFAIFSDSRKKFASFVKIRVSKWVAVLEVLNCSLVE